MVSRSQLSDTAVCGCSHYRMIIVAVELDATSNPDCRGTEEPMVPVWFASVAVPSELCGFTVTYSLLAVSEGGMIGFVGGLQLFRQNAKYCGKTTGRAHPVQWRSSAR